MAFRIGQGFDVHGFEPGKVLKLGGVTIADCDGLKGHSDADVVLHAVCDALLGGAGLGDLGEHFPDSDPKYKQYDSANFIETCLNLLASNGLSVENIDITVIAEKPRLSPYKSAIRERIACLLRCAPEQVNVKATTTERMGFVGRAEGIAAMAVVLLVVTS